MGRDTFSTYNPIINFTFYIGAIVFGVFFVHPAFLACAVVLSSAYYLSIKGTAGIKFLSCMLPVFIMLSVLNPLVNIAGENILFTWGGGRPYTLEALLYGAALGAMFVSVIIWFATYNEVITSDKFVYIFGRLIPSLSLVFTMVLRLVPGYMKKIHQISGARKCIGKGAGSGTKKENVESGLTILSALTTWAFEGGIMTADSMRSRGYGSGKRTSFSIYSFGTRDKLLLAVMLAAAGLIITAALKGGMETAFVPQISTAGFDNLWTIIGTISYFIFLAIPTILNVVEVITWRILRSRI